MNYIMQTFQRDRLIIHCESGRPKPDERVADAAHNADAGRAFNIRLKELGEM